MDTVFGVFVLAVIREFRTPHSPFEFRQRIAYTRLWCSEKRPRSSV